MANPLTLASAEDLAKGTEGNKALLSDILSVPQAAYSNATENVQQIGQFAKDMATNPQARERFGQQFAAESKKPISPQDVQSAALSFAPGGMALTASPKLASYMNFYGLTHPSFTKIAKDIETKHGPITSEETFKELFQSHPNFKNAQNDQKIQQLTDMGKKGPANLYQEFKDKGYLVNVENSKSMGSISTYFTVTHPNTGKSVKIRLSDHAPQDKYGGFEANDINTTPQHWKSAIKKADKLLSGD